MNNFEKIKNMSKKEMAKFLDEVSSCFCCIYGSADYEKCKDKDCKKGIKKWLKQEVEK